MITQRKFVIKVIVVIKVIIVIKELLGPLAETRDLLLHLVASNTMGIKCLVEVGDDETFQVEVGTAASILNTLNCC